MTKITIDNRDTENITIDTYEMFSGNSAYELECEYIATELGVSEPDAGYDISFDHAAIVRELAKHSTDIIMQSIKHTEYENIIQAVNVEKSTSPKFYNYTTDWYKMVVTYDEKALAGYMKVNHEAIKKIAKEYKAYESDITDDDMTYAAIVHILDNCIERDDYNMAMWEIETEVYYNHISHDYEKVTEPDHG